MGRPGVLEFRVRGGLQVQGCRGFIPRKFAKYDVHTRGVARILVWGGINFRDLVSMAVISLSRHDIPPPRVVRA